MEKKRRQHHVWRHYLDAWTVKGQLFCLRNDRIFPTGTTMVAVERDFYKLPKFEPGDIEYLHFLVVEKANEHAKKVLQDFVSMMTLPQRVVDENRSLLPNVRLIEEYLDKHRTNALEDYHAGIESAFLPLLARIKDGDLSFYTETDECIAFVWFISAQYLRTKVIRERVTTTLRDNLGLDVSRIWNMMSLMHSIVVGGTLYEERKRRNLTLLRNSTGVEFATSDQPVINLHAAGSATDKFTLYYPISPEIALLLSDVDEEPLFRTGMLTAEDVSKLNIRMSYASHNQTFARSKTTLVDIRAAMTLSAGDK